MVRKSGNSATGMSNGELGHALLDALDDDALSVLAERLRPYLADSDELLDAREAATRLGLHERTVARMAREGRIPGAVKVGRGWRFNADRLTPRAPKRFDPTSRDRRAHRTPGTPVAAAIRGAS